MNLKEQILEYLEVVDKPCTFSELQDALAANNINLNSVLHDLRLSGFIMLTHEERGFLYEIAKPMDKEYTEGTELDKSKGDWIDEAARTLTPEQFRGAMLFKIGEHLHGIDKKEEICEEVKNVSYYSKRWGAYEAVWLKK